jgi:dihydroorotase
MFDTLLSGGRVVTPDGLVRRDLAIAEGRVAAWLSPGAPAAARQTIDAEGLILLPGLVDAHVHFRDPGLTHKEDFSSGTEAAAAGGITTALVMPTDNPLTLTAADLDAKRRGAAGRLHVDIGLQALATGAEEVASLAAAGAFSIEVFLGDMPPAMMVADAGRFAAICAAAAAARIVIGVTPADDAVIAAAQARQSPEEASSRLGFFRSRPALSEALGTARAMAVAAATGAALHLRQVSCRESLAFLLDARARGLDVTAETTPHYLLLDETAIERLGPVAKVLPPLRPPEDLAALWAALRRGGLDMVATDHAPHAEAEKAAGEADIRLAPGGFPGVQTMLPLLLEAVAAGRIGWIDLQRLCCEAPARRFGLYPRKGSLAPGSDADVVLVDPARQAPIRNADQLSRARRTPFDGRSAQGWPVLTLLRGEVVMRHGALCGPPRGKVLCRAPPA